MKKIFFLISILILITGCDSYIELNDLGVIDKIGIQYNDNYKMYASIINNIDDDFNIEEKTIEVEGNNIQELLTNLSLSMNKKIYLSHLNLLIIDDSIKTNELKDLNNFFLNNNEAHSNFLVVSSNNIQEVLNNSKLNEINDLININNKETSKSLYTTMFDVMNNYYQNKPIYLSNIEYNDTIKINGLKKIHNNKIENINNEDTIFINYLLNNIDAYKEHLECDSNKYLNMEILSSNTNTLNNQFLITNELKIINNDCNLNNKDINKLFNTYLQDNLKHFTNKKITIRNTIRSYNENN